MKINKAKLSNGLSIVHCEDRSSCMVTVNILYKVGSRDETEDHTGMAHLFEHLMFGGSVNIPDYDSESERALAQNNAYTTSDLTNYYITLPTENIETAFWLESDRMLSLAFTQQSLEVQRSVVMEEFKERNLNQPYGDVMQLLSSMIYRVHPYRWQTIGLELSHIENVTMDQVKEFFFIFYAPNNAILSVTGNVKMERVMELAEKWFGPIPSRDVRRNIIPNEPIQRGIRRKTVRRPVPSNLLYMSFRAPGETDSQLVACDMITDVLSNGSSCRLTRNLVEKRHIFTDIDSSLSPSLDSSKLLIAGVPAEGVSMKEAEAAVWDELECMKQELASKTELQKLKNLYTINYNMEMASNQQLAATLAKFEMFGDANEINNQVKKYRSITPEQLRRTCRHILTKQNACVLYYTKEK